MNKSIQGSLFLYSEEKKLSAFMTESRKNGALVFIPGLTDGFLSLDYLNDLQRTLKDLNLTFVQPMLRSSYLQYGITSLQTDCEDLDELMIVLSEEYHFQKFFLMGHSTGCQDIVYFLKHSSVLDKVKVEAICLQGAVSDREWMNEDPNTSKWRQWCEDHKSQGMDTLLPREADIAPISIYRYLSLSGRLTDDDMFSTDLTDTEMESIFSHINMPTLFIYSSNDQYVPASVNKQKYVHRIDNAIRHCNAYLLQGADHEVSNTMSKTIFLQIVYHFFSNMFKKQYFYEE
ncbi:hypothetical protein WA158_005754 [Blastocystis sp. Blastoise]